MGEEEGETQGFRRGTKSGNTDLMISVEIPRAKQSLRESKEERNTALSQSGITSARQRKLLKSKPTLKTVLHTRSLHVGSELDTSADIASGHLKLRSKVLGGKNILGSG